MLLILTCSLLAKSVLKPDKRESNTFIVHLCNISNLPHINTKCTFWWPKINLMLYKWSILRKIESHQKGFSRKHAACDV